MGNCPDIILFCVVTFLCTRGLVQAADINYLRDTIIDHFSENRNHLVNKTNKDAAMRFIFDEFQRFGLDTEYNNFTYDFEGTAIEATFTNVVGVMKGSRFGTEHDKIIAVGAHYDTVVATEGVDDNGAGVAAMLEAARQITQMNVQRANTIIFISFDLEEYGLVGSTQFINTWVNPWLIKNYGAAAMSIKPYGVIVLDTVMEYNTSQNSQILPSDDLIETYFPDIYGSLSSDGFQGDFLTLIYRGPTNDADLAKVFETFWKSDSRDQFEIESLIIPASDIDTTRQLSDLLSDLYRSDHRSFWYDNIPAIFITDTADFRGDMKVCYHEMCDDVDTMLTDDNINFLGKTADIIVRTVHILSNPETSGASNVFQSTALLFLLSVLALLTTSE